MQLLESISRELIRGRPVFALSRARVGCGVGIEERRLVADIGRSRHLPVPYYVDPQKWYRESDEGAMATHKDGSQHLGKGNFIAYWGSRHVGEHCPACTSANEPQEVRADP